MRDIKFRGWCEDKKRMFTKVLIGNTTNPDSDDYTAHCIFRDGEWYNSDEHDDVKFMQFTGLTDIDGVGIYEGDVVEETRILADGKSASNIEVEYIGASFVVGDLKLSNGYFGISYRVIGNKFQNPELLEQ